MIDSQLSNAMLQARMHVRDGRLVDAEWAYRNIIARYPRFHPAYDALGCLAYGADKLAMAADLFRAAIELDKNVAIYHRNLGEICRRMGRFDEAIEAGRQACRLAPLDIDAHFNLGLGRRNRYRAPGPRHRLNFLSMGKPPYLDPDAHRYVKPSGAGAGPESPREGRRIFRSKISPDAPRGTLHGIPPICVLNIGVANRATKSRIARWHGLSLGVKLALSAD